MQEAIAEGGALLDIVRRIFVRLLTAVEREPELRAVMELSLFRTERTPGLLAARERQQESGRALLAGIAAAMHRAAARDGADGVATGELRAGLDPDEVARAFLALQNGAVYLWLQDPCAFSLQASAPALADILPRGIAPG